MESGRFYTLFRVYIEAWRFLMRRYTRITRGHPKLFWWLICFMNFVGFFIIGTINNLAYVVANSAAQDIVKYFNAERYIGIIPWANVAFGFVVRLMNAFLLGGVPYKLRILANSICMLLGILIVAFSVYVNFPFCVFGIILIGMSSSFGENVILGFLKDFPPELITGWSSGTGLAGVLGSALYLMFDTFEFTLTTSFLIISYFVALYMATFFFGLVKGKKNPFLDEEDDINDEYKEEFDESSETSTEEAREDYQFQGVHYPDSDLIEQDTDGISEEDPILGLQQHDSALKETFIERLVNFLKLIGFCIKHVWWRSFNLGMVYFFEYVISVMGADKAEVPGSRSSSYWPMSHSFIILAFCYQIGVFISRSSLKFFKVKKIEILTFLQFVNFIIWILLDILKLEFLGVWPQFIMMIYVGLLGGCSYVNVFYLVLNDEELTSKERELSVNIVALTINIGITFASLFMLVMDSTILLHK